MRSIYSLMLLTFFISCNSSDDDTVTSLGQTENDIIEFLDTNNIDAERTDSGLHFIIDEEGEGDLIAENAIVKLTYTGLLLDGSVFDTSSSDGYTFDLQSLIPGFSEGLTKFRSGGKGRLIIPPNLGYGSYGTSSIPGDAVLIFDIEILEVYNPQGEEDIIKYIDENSLVAENTDSGVYYIIDSVGDGNTVFQTSNVQINYTGYFLNGTEFEKSPVGGATINLLNTIPGFAEGLSKFKEGGKGTIILPPNLAYGESGSTLIPPNTVIVFDIEILSVN